MEPGNTPRPIPAQLVATAWKPGQSGNPQGRPKGIRYMRDLLGSKKRLLQYCQHLHALATSPGRQQVEALKLLLAYLLGPPNALTQAEESELAGLSLEELKERVKASLKAA